jgi:hypothetical protein
MCVFVFACACVLACDCATRISKLVSYVKNKLNPQGEENSWHRFGVPRHKNIGGPNHDPASGKVIERL